MKIKLIFFLIVFFFIFEHSLAEAARQFTVTQNPAIGTAFDMGSTQSITYTVTNTNTGGNSGERIYEMRFRIRNGSTFSNTTAAPTGWTRTAYSTTSVTFRATSWANSIVTGSSLGFTLVLVMRTTTADVNETLRDARASYTLDTNFSNGITRAGRTTINTPGLWTLKSLLITSFQTLDPTCTSPVSTILSGTNFCLRMTVQNISSATLNSIIANPNPPTATKTGTVTQSLVSTTYNPNPLTLAPGASGTISFVYSTAGADNGTIFFTANARNNTNSATSRSATSNTLAVSRLAISIAVRGPVVLSPQCIFSGDTATFTMTVTNNTGSTVTNITPSTLTATTTPGGGTIAVGAFSSPSPVCIASIANGSSGTFTWTASITGTLGSPKPTFYVTGSTLYNRTGSCPVPSGGTSSVTANSTLEDLDGYVVSLTPAATNASSTNEEIVWSITNYGCEAIQQVSIAGSIPAGWAWTGGDSYSLVSDTNLETWTVGGANPPVVFASPALADRLPKLQSGIFSLVFPTTPTPAVIPTTYTFNITITDANATPIVKTLPTTITVDAFDSTGPNKADTEVWKENY